ncbi:MAG TPA: alkaline phosphatase PhoX [Herpetosiphonaceae bacterium]
MTNIDRRTFLRRTAIASGALFGLEGLIARGALAAPHDGAGRADKGSGGYGPVYPRPARNTGEVLLALPEGFEYTVLSRTGSIMSNGRPTPPVFDGMAAFPVNGQVRLVRNHEIRNPIGTPGVAMGDQSKAYDPLAGGGTTTLIVDPQTRALVGDFVSLGGTLVNCAGGPTPWGTWISCEETTLGRRKLFGPGGRLFGGGFAQEHGYCFEVSTAADDQTPGVALRAMGRFVHEAVAVDPDTGIVYETEDQISAGFYRFIPDQPGNLAAGGRLQMLAIKDRPGYDTRQGQRMGKPLPVTWVDISDPDPTNADLNPLAVYQQGIAQGAATFARLEGCWYGNGSVFLNATSGGDRRLGQVWEYRPRGNSGGQLILLFESPSADVLDAPDNLCVSPRGGLVLCEDGRGDQYVRGLTQDGRIFDIAQNLAYVNGSANEFAGATFSPDGETLFVNIQNPGLTFAIWGPWSEGAL